MPEAYSMAETLPTIDDFREIAAQRGGEIIVDVDAEEITYPVSGRSYEDVQENSGAPRYKEPDSLHPRVFGTFKSQLENTLESMFPAGHGDILLERENDHIGISRRTHQTIRAPGTVDEADVFQETFEVQSIDRTIAWRAHNGIVYDPNYNLEGILNQRFIPGIQAKMLPLPIEAIEKFDIDPRDIEIWDYADDGATAVFHDGWNYYYRGGSIQDGWVGRLDMPVSSIEEAEQEALKPDSVIAAEQAGRDVTRQGDWFFVETDDEPTGILRRPEVGKPINDDQLGNHIAEWQGIKIDHPPRVFVKGEIEHRNGDHRSVQFDEWREAVNNGVEAWSFEVPARVTPDRLVDLGLMTPNEVQRMGARGANVAMDGSTTNIRMD